MDLVERLRFEASERAKDPEWFDEEFSQAIVSAANEIERLRDDLDERCDDGAQALIDFAAEMGEAATLAIEDGKLVEAGALTFAAHEARLKAEAFASRPSPYRERGRNERAKRA